MFARVSRRRRLTFTTRLDPDHSPAPDMVNRQFVADGPNQPSLAGMTCIPTWQGLIYLKTVVDVWSGRVVGWSIGEHMHAEPVFSALDMALGSREPKNLIHHGDQRSQYVTLAFGKRCWEMGVPPPDGHGWRRLRQDDGREILCLSGVRKDRPQNLTDQDRSASGSLHLDQRLVQLTPATFGAGQPFAHELRGETPRS